jgi:hypothetical protein
MLPIFCHKQYNLSLAYRPIFLSYGHLQVITWHQTRASEQYQCLAPSLYNSTRWTKGPEYHEGAENRVEEMGKLSNCVVRVDDYLRRQCHSIKRRGSSQAGHVLPFYFIYLPLNIPFWRLNCSGVYMLCLEFTLIITIEWKYQRSRVLCGLSILV